MTTFVLTEAGQNAISAASPTGPRVVITGFRLGDDDTTPATATGVGASLVGSLVFQGPVTSYSYFDANTIQVNLEIPALAGPFQYGEVVLDLEDGTVLARFSYGSLRTKVESSTTGYANVTTIKALLRIAEGVHVFEFPPSVQQTILEVDTLQVLQTPQDHPNNPVVLVSETNDYQEGIQVFRNSSTLWNLTNYYKLGVASITAAPNATTIVSSLFALLSLAPSGMRGRYVIQTQGGYLRSITSISGTSAILAQPLNTTILIGQLVAVYELTTARMSSLTQSLGLAQSEIDLLKQQIAQAQRKRIGEVFLSGSNNIPVGALRAHGQEVSRTTESVLFAEIGTTFGAGNGTTTFNVPDARGVVLRGLDSGRGLDVGRVIGTYQEDMIKEHAHSIATTGNDTSGPLVADASASGTNNTSSTGTIGGIETRMKNLALYPYIQAR